MPCARQFSVSILSPVDLRLLSTVLIVFCIPIIYTIINEQLGIGWNFAFWTEMKNTIEGLNVKPTRVEYDSVIPVDVYHYFFIRVDSLPNIITHFSPLPRQLASSSGVAPLVLSSFLLGPIWLRYRISFPTYIESIINPLLRSNL